jgi:hypothetical protein
MTGAGEAATPRRWLVAQGEGRALFAAAGAYFLLLAGYYMLRSLREAFALEVGRDYIATLFYVTFVVMLGVLPLYWYVVGALTAPSFISGDLFGGHSVVRSARARDRCRARRA